MRVEDLIKAANHIEKVSRTPNANYLIVSPAVAEAINMLNIKHQRRKKLDKINEEIQSKNKKKR